MAIGNVELMLECFPQHLHQGTARMKKDIEQRAWKRCPDGLIVARAYGPLGVASPRSSGWIT